MSAMRAGKYLQFMRPYCIEAKVSHAARLTIHHKIIMPESTHSAPASDLSGDDIAANIDDAENAVDFLQESAGIREAIRFIFDNAVG